MSGQCRSCGARIIWALSAAGRYMPLDAKPVEQGQYQLLDGVASYVPLHLRIGFPEPLYESHFATCPNASAHRGAKG